MNLGIKREMLGDINIKGKDAYVYCVSHIADFIVDNLSTVKHTHIQCTKTDINDIECSPELEDIEVLSASERIDAAVASLTKLSRSQAVELFRARKIFINSRQMENNSYQLKANDILVIREQANSSIRGAVEKQKKAVFIFHSENIFKKRAVFLQPQISMFFYLKIYQMKHNT